MIDLWTQPLHIKFMVKKVNLNFIKNIHRYILGKLRPNITFLLKVSAKSSRRRLLKRKTLNRYDNLGQSFYNRAQNAFLKIAKNKKELLYF